MTFSYIKKFIPRVEYSQVQISRMNEFVSQIGLQTGPSTSQSTNLSAKSSGLTTQDPTQNLVEADPAQGADTHQIATFLDDAAIQEATLPGLVSPEVAALAPASERRQHTIEDILSRPMLVSSATWVVGALQNSDLVLDNASTILSFPSALIDAVDIIQDKIKNFTYLRADICIRVTVNASTFQLGKLLAYFAPFSQVVGSRALLNEHLSAKTTFPHIVLDAATGNTGVLRIPYVSPYTHYNLITQQGDMGNLKITVLNQLRGGIDVTVSAFAWFENIDLGVPTDATRFTTFVSAPETIPLADQKVLAKLIKDGYIRVSRKVKDDAERLLAKEEFVSQMAEDRDKSSTGIITDTLEHIGSAATNMAGLPLIGNIFKPVSWVANAASRVSGALGFCKPTSVATQNKFQQQPAFGYTHATGLDQSTTLGAQPDNQLVEKSGLFGSNVDEMDIKFLTSRNNWIETFDWTKDSTASEILYSMPVAPGICTPLATPAGTYEPTMLAYVSAPFKYWTGGLTYTVQVAKTSYHSGRLRISFVPSGTAGVNYDANNCYTWILDLRTSNQIEFTIPYTANTQYKNFTIFPKGVAPDVSFTTGVLQFEVLNKLRLPEGSVSEVVQLNVWIKGAEDYALAIPDFTKYVPYRPTGVPPQPIRPVEYVGLVPDDDYHKLIPPGGLLDKNRVKRNIDYDIDSDFESQVLGTFQDPGFNDFSPASKMFEMSTTTSLEKAGLSVGEQITSVRQLIKRFGYRKILSRITSSKFVSGSTAYFGRAFTGTELLDEDTQAMSPVEYYSWIYRFYRGSRRYKLMSSPNPIVTTAGGAGIQVPFAPAVDVFAAHKIATLNVPEAIDDGDSTSDKFLYRYCLSANFSNYTYSGSNEVTEITCPFYSNCHILPIMGVDGDILSDIKYNEFLFELRARTTEIPNETTPLTTTRLMVAAGDDLNFGWVVGQPTLGTLVTV